jgi:glycosyltransferase involved in cell wall biosynthesis
MAKRAGEPRLNESARPRIAVVIPVHNRRLVVQRAIDSVLRQDLTDFELVVVDDGSTDGSADVVGEISDPRIRVIREGVRRGGNAARNRGFRETTAPIVAFLDSDDEFLPYKLSTVIATFERQPDLGTLVDSYAIVNPRKYGGRPEDLINPVIETSEAFLAALFNSTIKSRRVRKATSGISVRREVALRAGLFDESVERRQDMEFLVRLAKVARCATIDQRLWTKYEQSDSISFTGDGFIAATLVMGSAHPDYARKRAYLPADVVIYLWETIKRCRYKRVAGDLKHLAREFGVISSLALIARGAWAWLVDPRLASVFRRSSRARQAARSDQPGLGEDET